jgi:hypothetical protein
MTDEENKEFERRIGHRVNGDLPVRLLFGNRPEPEFRVPKQRSGPAISEKKAEIRAFVAQLVQVQYIPAVRTAQTALEVVEDMVQRELSVTEQDADYVAALARIRELHEPILAQIAGALEASLSDLLPDVKGVRIEVEERGYRSMGATKLIVDDGNPTDLALKGDGVQSLAAISLIRHYAAETARSEALILAVEEPEAHLHPSGVHALRAVLEDISAKQQVVVTAHSPLLVNRLDVASNIIVKQTRATPAKSVGELRETLGVRTSDNLEGADVILVAEGAEDGIALRALLADRSERLRQALASGALHIQPLYGAGKLHYVLGMVRDSLCLTHALLDDDEAGRQAADKARRLGFLAPGDQTFTSRTGAAESEIEDLYDVAIYREAVRSNFNVDSAANVGQAKKLKWSSKMRLRFRSAGQAWDDEIEAALKRVVADAVAESPSTALSAPGEAVMTALVDALHRKLSAARAA